ncbi:MAG: SH3 domain-containing protein [Melioribacter sp.]|uniref:SH3 domain-containing protein n=1 Tax=Rosettibacter primus TaxID=3111523 RepID=UPI00247E48F4|nr:SH3 domain-containing protein [Melioribacter sp.]
MKYTVIKRYKSNYSDPITIKKGEKIKLGKKYDGPEDWPNWLYCYKLNSSQEGWVPEQIIRKTGEYGIVEKDYTAKELDVEEGEQVDGTREINGWIWCRRDKNYEEGWVPKSNLIKNE